MLARRVRPYTLVGGRTRPSTEIPLETLVRTTPQGAATLPRLAMERSRIASLCRSPISIAEISAHVGIPLGVARVLVGDMADEGLVDFRVRSPGPADRADLELLERVLHGLQTL